MFSVIAEVQPRPGQLDAYLGNATLLRPELEHIDGFVENVRYRSLTRDGWVLSLSDWRDEKALVRWRTAMHHHEVQGKGRREILQDYRVRVGEVTADTNVPAGHALAEQRLDVRGVRLSLGDGELSGAVRTSEHRADHRPAARGVGRNVQSAGLCGIPRARSVCGEDGVVGRVRRAAHAG